jgi:hypothetical protein
MRYLTVLIVLLAVGMSYAADPTNVLIYVDSYVGTALYNAVVNLGWPTNHYYYYDYNGFSSAISNGTQWDVIAVSAYYYYSFSYWGSNMDGFVNGNYGGTGKAVVSSFEMNTYSSSPLWADMGASWAGDLYYITYSVYAWDPSCEVFTTPNNIPGPFNVDSLNYYDQGDTHDGLTKRSGVEVAGTTASEQGGKGIICIGAYDQGTGMGPTILATLCTDSMSDQTTAVKLWENMLTYVWSHPTTSIQPTSLGKLKAQFN